MHIVLSRDPTHHGPLTAAFYIGRESIRGYHVVVNRHCLRPCKGGKQASYRYVHSAETVSSKIGTAVGEFGAPLGDAVPIKRPARLLAKVGNAKGDQSRFRVCHRFPPSMGSAPLEINTQTIKHRDWQVLNEV